MKKSNFFYITGTIGVLLGIAVIAMVTLAIGWVVSMLWNFALVPQGLHIIDMYQGAALVILAQLLLPTPGKRFFEANKGLNKIGSAVDDAYNFDNNTKGQA